MSGFEALVELRTCEERIDKVHASLLSQVVKVNLCVAFQLRARLEEVERKINQVRPLPSFYPFLVHNIAIDAFLICCLLSVDGQHFWQG